MKRNHNPKLALLRRINRALAKDGKKLHKSRKGDDFEAWPYWLRLPELETRLMDVPLTEGMVSALACKLGVF